MISVVDEARRNIARRLERGAGPAATSPIEHLWGRLAPIARPLRVPRGVRVLTVGGATLGGSGKTPLAIACALAVARAGAKVAFVGHWSARDEAAEAASALASANVPLFVERSRQRAVDRAAAAADVLVIDGPLNLSPVRSHLALLAVDGASPFGSGLCPPRGDLRATPARLRGWADAVVSVGDGDSAGVATHHAPLTDLRVRGRSRAARPLADWAGQPVQVATAIARPERFLRTLARHGVVPSRHLERPDHDGRPLPPGKWLVPRKNAHLAAGRGPDDEVLWVEYDISLPSSLMTVLASNLAIPGAYLAGSPL